MNTDIRINTSFYEHPKIVSLGGMAGIEACFCLVILWCVTAKIKPDGNLGGISPRDIAVMARWSGDPDEFVDALLSCGLLDLLEDGSYRVHDWEDHNAYAAAARERKEQARKAAKTKNRNGNLDPDEENGKDHTKWKNVQLGQNDTQVHGMGQNDPQVHAFEKCANARLGQNDTQVHAPESVHLHDENVHLETENVHLHGQNVHLETENVHLETAQNGKDEEKRMFLLDAYLDPKSASADSKNEQAISYAPSPSRYVYIKNKESPPFPVGHPGYDGKVGKSEFVQAVVDAFRNICPDLPKPRKVNSSSKLYRQISARCRGAKERRKLSWWVGYWERVARSEYLLGKVRDWRADAQWLTEEENMDKVLEGKYDRRFGGNGSAARPRGMSPVSPSGTFEDVPGFFEEAMAASG